MEPKLVDGSAINGGPQMSHGEKTARGIAQAIVNGTEWGSFGVELAARNRHAADVYAEQLRLTLIDLLVSGCTGPTSVARELNERSIPTRSGGRWYPETAYRLMRRLGPSLLDTVHQQRAERCKNTLNSPSTHERGGCRRRAAARFPVLPVSHQSSTGSE
jgi:hypothetical protein